MNDTVETIAVERFEGHFESYLTLCELLGLDPIGYDSQQAQTKAVEEIRRLRKIEAAAKSVSDTLDGGFIVCQRCGEQETTSDVDFAAELRTAIKRALEPC